MSRQENLAAAEKDNERTEAREGCRHRKTKKT